MQPEKVLKELRELWDSLGKAEGGSAGVLRACSMTLIVAAGDDADAQAVSETLAELMHEHPSRLIVVRAGAGAGIEARVFAQCWMPFGRRQQICCEQIEITAGLERMADVAQACLPLLAPDLPLVIWQRGARAFEPGALARLYPMAEKIIFDSETAPDVSGALRYLKELRGSGRRVGDLAWTRVTVWRALVAQAFEAGGWQAVREARVAAPPAAARYLAAWLKRGLARARVDVAADKVPGVWFRGDGVDVVLAAVDGAVEVRAGEHSRRALLPPATDYALMREELAILGPDQIYDEVLALVEA